MYRGITLAFTLLTLMPACLAGNYQPMGGDILFQTSPSSQSLAIQKATHSPYSHVGMVVFQDGKPFVLEAVEPVRMTPLADWVSWGVDGHFTAKRLRDAPTRLTDHALQTMWQVGKPFLGIHYDATFEWSDQRIYCSELVWKIYKRGLGLEIGKIQTLDSFDLSDPVVKAILQKRYGDTIPGQEPVISPAAMFASELLVTVHQE